MTEFCPCAVVLSEGDGPAYHWKQSSAFPYKLHTKPVSWIGSVTIHIACLSCQFLTWLLLETMSVGFPLSFRMLSVKPGWDGWHSNREHEEPVGHILEFSVTQDLHEVQWNFHCTRDTGSILSSLWHCLWLTLKEHIEWPVIESETFYEQSLCHSLFLSPVFSEIIV